MQMAEMQLRRMSILVLFAAMAFSASALTVGIAPAEGMAYSPPPEGSGSPIGFLVSGCMDALFDAGHITTDSAVARDPRDSWGPSDYGLASAREGLVDYVIALYVKWRPSAYHKEAALPSSIDYRLVRILDGKVLAEGSVQGPPDSESASSHEASTASQAGLAVAEPCIKILSTLAMGGEK